MSLEKEGKTVAFIEKNEEIPNFSRNKYGQTVNFIAQILQSYGYSVNKKMFGGGIKVQGKKTLMERL